MSNERIPMVEEGERVAIFNNVTNKVRDDLIKTIREGSQNDTGRQSGVCGGGLFLHVCLQ